jgi:hypothetical protein
MTKQNCITPNKRLLGGVAIASSALLLASLAPATSFASVPVDPDGKVKMYGDVRVRTEMDNREKQDGTKEKRNRLRYRVRLGVAFQPNDHWSGKIRLATTGGQNSPHRNFATASSTADNNFGVETAFIAYTDINNLTLVGGKTPLNFWQQNEVFWDIDINPDALAAVYKTGPVTLNTTYAVLTKGNWDSKPDNMTALIYQAVFKSGDSMKYTVALV